MQCESLPFYNQLQILMQLAASQETNHVVHEECYGCRHSLVNQPGLWLTMKNRPSLSHKGTQKTNTDNNYVSGNKHLGVKQYLSMNKCYTNKAHWWSLWGVLLQPLKLQPWTIQQQKCIHTHPFNVPLSRTTWVSRYQNQSGFYWSKRQWVAVASAGPYASLHLVSDR